MPRQVALIRAINLGSRRRVAMRDLRGVFEDVGCTDVATLLNSGNVVFESDDEPDVLEPRLERAAEDAFGFASDIYIRTGAEWASIVARNPFGDVAEASPTFVTLMVCRDDVADGLTVADADRHVVRASGREVFINLAGGRDVSIGKLGVRGTARNWNTVLRLASLANG